MRNAVEEEGIFLAYSVMSQFPPKAVTGQQNHHATVSYKFLSSGSSPSSCLVILCFSFFSSLCPATNKIKPYNSFLPAFFFTYADPYRNAYLILHTVTEAFLIKS